MPTINARMIGTALGAMCILACQELPERQTDPSTNADAAPPPVGACAPGSEIACRCADNAPGASRCSDDGSTFLPCDCTPLPDGGALPSPDAGVGNPPPGDSGVPPTRPDSKVEPPKLPATCDQDPVVELPGAPEKGTAKLYLVDRHLPDGTVTHYASMTLADYALTTGGLKAGTAFGETCRAFLGPRKDESAKHCEYTTTTCQTDANCADGVACRATDRLNAESIKLGGQLGSLTLKKQEMGLFTAEGTGQILADADSQGYKYWGASISIVAGDLPHTFYYRPGYMPPDSLPLSYSYSGSLEPPARVVKLTAPDLSGSARLVPKQDLVFQWAKRTKRNEFGSVSAIIIEIRGEQESKTDPGKKREVGVMCVVKDDGCKKVPAAAVDFLLQSDATWKAPTKFDAIVADQYHATLSIYGTLPARSAIYHWVAETHGSLLAP